MLIYSTEITPRLSYACEVLFKPWNIRWEITNDFTFFETVSGPKINYSKTESRPGSITLHPLPLLFEKGISKQPANLFYRDEIPSFFQSSSQSIPFDLFAATFYLASRYEEYQHFEKDFMGRFEAGNSSSHQLGFLRLPLIDIWRKRLGEELEKLWPDQPFRTEGFSALSTIDVDSAFAYKHKGLIRIAGGYAKDFTGFRFCNMANRTSALLGATKDPYDTYDFIIAEYQRTGIPLHFFFLLADFGKFDKNVSNNRRR
ncbi:MAG: hypothetical protein IT223_01060 [Crocinitomicaceae bacterium]|nr:hypothetical protein [Crocinitomicaceae bacterium]